MKKTRNEFRRNKRTNHPSYVFEQEGNYCKSHGLTHSKKTFGKDNIPLSQNPNPKDDRQAFARPDVQCQHRADYGKKYGEWTLSPGDIKRLEKRRLKDLKKKQKH